MIIVKILVLIVCCLLALILGGCFKKPKPEPEPEPEPEDEWEDYYPVNWYKPVIDINAHKWRERNFDSPEWETYENTVLSLMKKVDRENKFDDLTLARILTSKTDDGRYLFKWTSDMEIWEETDHWATPAEFLILKDENGNPDPNGLYRDDCDGFAGFHCDFLYRLCNYWIVWFIEVYWKKRYFNDFSNNYQWKAQGHAITIYQRTAGDMWRCFSNQTFLGMTNGYATIQEIIEKFCPDDENHELNRVVARHPIEGELLWQITRL